MRSKSPRLVGILALAISALVGACATTTPAAPLTPEQNWAVARKGVTIAERHAITARSGDLIDDDELAVADIGIQAARAALGPPPGAGAATIGTYIVLARDSAELVAFVASAHTLDAAGVAKTAAEGKSQDATYDAFVAAHPAGG